jgi:NAD(P)H-dependent FMN reductase
MARALARSSATAILDPSTTDEESMPKLMIIIASTRPGRVGEPVARWFIERATEHGAFEIHVVDLAELDLPFLDEPHHPRLHRYTKDHTHEWSEMVNAADAFVFVTSEYNHGYPASLKNAIDYLNHEWKDKPVGFVSYGGVSAGTRAVQQLKQVVTALKLYPVVEAVNIPFVAQFLDGDGVVQANEVMEQAANAMLDEIGLVERALRALREQRAAAAHA